VTTPAQPATAKDAVKARVLDDIRTDVARAVKEAEDYGPLVGRIAAEILDALRA
jgi:hypothetical protein